MKYHDINKLFNYGVEMCNVSSNVSRNVQFTKFVYKC